MQKMLGYMRKAIQEYNMLSDGDLTLFLPGSGDLRTGGNYAIILASSSQRKETKDERP